MNAMARQSFGCEMAGNINVVDDLWLLDNLIKFINFTHDHRGFIIIGSGSLLLKK